jgi:hypothetical protein
MTANEQIERDRKELIQIEENLYRKFKHLENEDFLRKSKYDPDELMDYEAMIEALSEIVQQHLWDEDIAWPCELNQIEEKQWDKWLEEYDVPEQCCDRCGGRGCNYCLMCSY